MNGPGPDIIAAAYSFPHHSAHSGYHRIAEFAGCTAMEIPPGVRKFVARATPGIVRSILVKVTGLQGYFPECAWLERNVRREVRRRPGAIVHFLYPENSYYFSRTLPPESCRLVATYHQPPEEARRFIIKKDPLKRLDAVVLLSDSQREFFEPIVGAGRIAVVPHGVDTKFFSPVAGGGAQKRIVAVGSWLRDFVTLAEIVRLLEKADPGIVCDIVAAPRVRALLGSYSNVRFHTAIADEALRELYRGASLAIFPLNGAAANNALLEAMACGLPVVATDLPAIREYASSDTAVYVPRDDAGGFTEAIIGLLSDEERRARMGTAARLRAGGYAWEVVGEGMREVYKQVWHEWKGGN